MNAIITILSIVLALKGFFLGKRVRSAVECPFISVHHNFTVDAKTNYFKTNLIGEIYMSTPTLRHKKSLVGSFLEQAFRSGVFCFFAVLSVLIVVGFAIYKQRAESPLL